MKMELKDFVEIINNQEEFKVDKVGPDDKAKALADVFLNSKDKKEEELNCIIQNNDSTDNDIACAKIILNAKDNNGKYKYIQEDDLFAEVKIFEPYIDNKDRVLNQKWHVLISCLAFLDVSSFDEKCKEDGRFTDYNIGKITKIEFENEKLRIYHEKEAKGKKVKSYSSLGMTGAIKKAVDNSF